MDELINRQDLSNEIQRIYDEHYCDANSQTVHDIFHAVLKRIDKAKVVDSEPVVHGRWIESVIERTMGALNGYKCSVCGHEKTGRTCLYNYCPECGAKMDIKEEERETY